MSRTIVLPLLALAGAAFALFMISFSARKPPVARIVFQPPASPYKHYIAGQGSIEPINQSIAIGVPFPELVAHVFVKVGDTVTKGSPLFKLDTRRLEAALAQALGEEQVALTAYENTKVQFAFYEKLQDSSAVSQQDYATALYRCEIARKQVDVAHAAVNAVRTDIERSLIIAPIDGEVLQTNVKVGEVVNINPFTEEPPVVFGNTTFYHLRINIDEEDVWRFIKGAPATAFVRGNARIFIPLEFVYVEPYVVVKKSLTGSDIERVDTRVLQVVYRFSKNQYPVYLGQLLDAFVEAQPSETH